MIWATGPLPESSQADVRNHNYRGFGTIDLSTGSVAADTRIETLRWIHGSATALHQVLLRAIDHASLPSLPVKPASLTSYNLLSSLPSQTNRIQRADGDFVGRADPTRSDDASVFQGAARQKGSLVQAAQVAADDRPGYGSCGQLCSNVLLALPVLRAHVFCFVALSVTPQGVVLTVEFGSGTQKTHKYLGIAVTVAGCLQPLNALFRKHPKESFKRKLWFCVHAYLGRAAVVCGLYQV